MSINAWKTTMLAILTVTAFSTVQAGPAGGSGEKGEGKRAEIKDRLLKKFDADGDGVLSDTEKAAMKADQDAMIAKYDTDKDGKLSEAERQAVPKKGKKAAPKK